MSLPGQTEKGGHRSNHCRSLQQWKKFTGRRVLPVSGNNDLPLGDNSSSSNALVGPMTRWEAAADVRRGRAFLRQGIRELGELAEPTVGLDCATLLR
jgi:hypothetical protein